MFTRFKKQSRTLLLDAKLPVDPEIIEGRVDVVLSPSLYWVKRVELPIKRLYDVKKILPSLFEDILPDHNYSYAVFKDAESYVAFAYKDESVLALLEEKKIPLSHVGGIYFAQNELQGYLPLRIDENTVLVEEEDVVVCIPGELAAEDVEYKEITTHKPTSKPVVLEHYSHIIDSKTLMKIGGLVAAFCVVVFAEYFVVRYKINQLEDAREEIVSRYHLFATMMQNRSVLQKYERRFTKQSKLREYLAKFLQLKLNKTEYIELVQVKGNELQVVLHGVKDKNHILWQLGKMKKLVELKEEQGKLDIRVKL